MSSNLDLDSNTNSFNELKDNSNDETNVANTSIIDIDAESNNVHKTSSTIATSYTAKETSSTGFESFTTSAERFSTEWFTFYLKQTRVLIALLLTVFFLSLILAAYIIGKATVQDNASAAICPAWGDIVPSVTNRCPTNTLQIYFGYSNAIEKGKDLTRTEVNNNNNYLGPSAVFLPGATPLYYYTIIILDADTPEPSQGIVRVLGIVDNLKLSGSLDIIYNNGNANWVVGYEPPEPSAGRHRIVYLVYRYTSKVTGVAPASRNNFNAAQWVAAQSWTGALPEFVAANYFFVRAGT